MSDVRCVSGVEFLADYLDGVLEPAMQVDLEQHVAGCARCQAFLASYRAVPQILRNATDKVLPDDLRLALRTVLGLT